MPRCGPQNMPREIGVNVSANVLEKILDNQNQLCFGCDCDLSGPDSIVQHRMAKTLGGTNEESNLLVVCQNCHGHSLKSLRLPNFLLSQIENWKAENQIHNSLSTILRHAMVKQMSREKLNPEQIRR